METSELRKDRIDAHRDAQTCSVCGKHLDYSAGWYTVTHAHYDCEFPTGAKSILEELGDATKKFDESLAALGFKRKRQQSKIGEGGPTKKLKELIEISAKEHFGAEVVSDINIYIAPPVWRQARFDVMRLEGDMCLDGRKVNFGSWAGVTALIKYERLMWDNDWPFAQMLPVTSTKKTRTKQHSKGKP